MAVDVLNSLVFFSARRKRRKIMRLPCGLPIYLPFLLSYKREKESTSGAWNDFWLNNSGCHIWVVWLPHSLTFLFVAKKKKREGDDPLFVHLHHGLACGQRD